VTFRLKRPQPASIALLASGFSPAYPCPVSPKEMRQHPIGTGPFKLVEFKPDESIKVTRNPDYWKPGRPYLDGIEYTIIRNVSTAILTFVSGKLDITFGGLSVPLARDVKNQAPQAFCELNPTNISRNLVINCDVAPFDNPELRRAMALSLDRQAFLDIITEGKGNLGGVMLPPPEGVWIARNPDCSLAAPVDAVLEAYQRGLLSRSQDGRSDPRRWVPNQRRRNRLYGRSEALDLHVSRFSYEIGLALENTW